MCRFDIYRRNVIALILSEILLEKTGGLMELSRVVKPPVITNQNARPGGCGGTFLFRLSHLSRSECLMIIFQQIIHHSKSRKAPPALVGFQFNGGMSPLFPGRHVAAPRHPINPGDQSGQIPNNIRASASVIPAAMRRSRAFPSPIFSPFSMPIFSPFSRPRDSASSLAVSMTLLMSR